MRALFLTFAVTLLAMSVAAAPALAAPKKAQLAFSSGSYSAPENSGTFNVRVNRTGNTRSAVSVTLSVDPSSTASSPADYTVSTGTLNFAANETSKTIPVTIVDNATSNPPNKKIVFKLSAGSAGTQIKRSTATLTIIDNEGPGTLDFSSDSYAVVEGVGVATLTVNRIGASNLKLSVDYATSNGTATAPSDFTAIPGFPASTVVFEPGEVTKTIQVPVTDDQAPEPDPETFTVTLSNPKNLTAGPAPQIGPNSPSTVTINDDDVSTFSFDSSIYSVDEDKGPATITVDRAGATNLPASVTYSTGGGTATAGADYTAIAGATLNFAAGETQKTFTVAITNDATDEGNETVGLSLGTGDTSTLSIVDDDQPSESVQFSDTTYSVAECDCNAHVTLTLSHQLSQDVTIKFSAAGGTATGGSDFTVVTNQTVTFTAGETSKTVDVPILQDTDSEDPETIALSLSTPSVPLLLGSPSTATLTINDDDPTGDLEFESLGNDVNETAGSASVVVHRVGGGAGTVTVDYATADGTATAGSDYTASSGTLTFGPGELTKTIQIPVAWDGRGEGTETVALSLSNPTGGADLAANDAAVLRIADDGASGPLTLSGASLSAGEAAGAVTVTVTRSGGSLGGPVSVDYATADGSAIAGTDYTAKSGTLTFAAGETSKSFDVAILDDSVHEDGESFQVVLSNPGGGAALGAPAAMTVAIADDDAASAVNGRESGPANPTAAGSQTAGRKPKLTVSAKAVQKALKAKLIALVASCDVGCKVVVVAKVGKARKALTLGKASATARAGQKAKLKVKLNKKALAKLRKALKHGKAKVKLAVVATGPAGARTTASKIITVR